MKYLLRKFTLKAFIRPKSLLIRPAFMLQPLCWCSCGVFGFAQSALVCTPPPAVLSDRISVSPHSSPRFGGLVNGPMCESPATSRWPRRDWHAKKKPSSCKEKWEFRSSVRNPLTIQQFFSSNPDRLCFPLLYALLTTATTGSAGTAPAPDPRQNGTKNPAIIFHWKCTWKWSDSTWMPRNI